MNGNIFPPRPGTWVPGKDGAQRAAFFTCPTCGTYGPLAGTHEIATSGEVTPIVICPACDFQGHITLLGW